MKDRLTCALALSALLALTSCASTGNGSASARIDWWSCAPLHQYDEMIRTIQSTPLETGFLRVPVVVHLMDSRNNSTAVKDRWANQKLDYLKTFFASAPANHSVNQVWAKAGIRLDLERVEHCLYPDSFLTDSSKGPVLRMPEPAMMRNEPASAQQERIELYLAINQMYGHRGKLNLYFWDLMSQGVHGYGESPRRNRIEVVERGLDALPTAWYSTRDRECKASGERLRCQMFLAHEIGHALGLKHVCRACSGPLNPPELPDKHCCTAVCWAERNHYAYPDHVPKGALCIAPPADGTKQCCCGCEPGELARDGINACGQPVACCGEALRSSLMYVNASFTKTGELCDGEVQSVRSAVRDFFPGRAGGHDGKRRE